MSDSSDDEVFESKISPPAETKVKAKRQLTKAQLSQLALAREKANAVRKQNALHRKTQKDKEQQLKEMRRQQEIDCCSCCCVPAAVATEEQLSLATLQVYPSHKKALLWTKFYVNPALLGAGRHLLPCLV